MVVAAGEAGTGNERNSAPSRLLSVNHQLHPAPLEAARRHLAGRSRRRRAAARRDEPEAGRRDAGEKAPRRVEEGVRRRRPPSEKATISEATGRPPRLTTPERGMPSQPSESREVSPSLTSTEARTHPLQSNVAPGLAGSRKCQLLTKVNGPGSAFSRTKRPVVSGRTWFRLEYSPPGPYSTAMLGRSHAVPQTRPSTRPPRPRTRSTESVSESTFTVFGANPFLLAVNVTSEPGTIPSIRNDPSASVVARSLPRERPDPVRQNASSLAPSTGSPPSSSRRGLSASFPFAGRGHRGRAGSAPPPRRGRAGRAAPGASRSSSARFGPPRVAAGRTRTFRPRARRHCRGALRRSWSGARVPRRPWRTSSSCRRG